MRCGFAFLFRVAIWGGAVVLIVATLLGRSERRPPVRRPTFPREPASPRYHAFDGSLFRGHGYEPRLLDTETGRFGPLELTGAGTFDKLSFSPWCDAAGQHHVVGHWRGAVGTWERRLPGVAGIARWTYPGGRVLDCIASDVIPLSPPCWLPDRSDRVLFGATDGRLYLLDFRDAGDIETEQRPRPLGWVMPPAGIEVLLVRDPCWAPGGCLVAAVCWRACDAEPGPRARSQLWWLRLSPDGTEIVASGRLFGPGEGEGEFDEFAPSVGPMSEGTAMLAYLAGPRGERPAELRVAPIAVEGGSTRGVPRVRADAVRLAAADIPTAPAFSPDGRWLYAVVQSRAAGGLTIKRIAVTPDGRPAAPLGLESASGPGRSCGAEEHPPASRGPEMRFRQLANRLDPRSSS